MNRHHNLKSTFIQRFVHEYGAPTKLIMDNAGEQTGHDTDMMKTIQKHQVRHRQIEPQQYNHNKAEAAIRELKWKWYRTMLRIEVPKRLWDCGLRWASDIQQRTTNTTQSLRGHTPLEELTGETPDISEFLNFSFYDHVYVWENAGLGERTLARWLGVSHHIGSQMCYFIIKGNSQILSWTSVQRVTQLELQTDEVCSSLSTLDQGICDRLNDANHVLLTGKDQPIDWRRIDVEQDPDFLDEFHNTVNDPKLPEADAQRYEPDVGADTYIDMHISLPTGPDEAPQLARVTKRVKGPDGLPIGTANANLLLDSHLYEVELADGHHRRLTANQIAENMLSHVDEHGHRQAMFRKISDHRCDDTAVSDDRAFISDKRGRPHRRRLGTVGHVG